MVAFVPMRKPIKSGTMRGILFLSSLQFVTPLSSMSAASLRLHKKDSVPSLHHHRQRNAMGPLASSLSLCPFPHPKKDFWRILSGKLAANEKAPSSYDVFKRQLFRDFKKSGLFRPKTGSPMDFVTRIRFAALLKTVQRLQFLPSCRISGFICLF